MQTKARIIEILYDSIDEINSQSMEEQQLEKSEGTVLFGENGRLDSLTLVKLIVCTEQRLEEAFDRSFTLADEKAMSLKNSPFLTVGTLVDYIAGLVQDNAAE